MKPIFLLLLVSALAVRASAPISTGIALGEGTDGTDGTHAHSGAPISIDIDLSAQKAFLLQDGKIVYETPISSGRAGHPTPTGDFLVLDKDENHLSSLYGRIVDGGGKTIVPNADCATPVPRGARFVQAPMRHFLRFDGAAGLHAGYLPGYPASHGCVRLPPAKAALFFNIAAVGTPVHVHGTPPSKSGSIISKSARNVKIHS